MNKLFATSIAAFALLAAAPAAIAGNNNSAVQIRHQIVAYGDLDLTNNSDADALKGRLQLAAKNVCVATYSAGSISPVFEAETYKACTSTALNNAMNDVGKRMASR
jgi:UrcA family protein